MVATDVENAVAAQEIKIGGVIHIVEIGALGPRVDFVEADHALGGDESAIEMPLVQLIVFAQAGGDQFFEINCHGRMVSDLETKRKPRASSRDKRLARPLPNLSCSRCGVRAVPPATGTIPSFSGSRCA